MSLCHTPPPLHHVHGLRVVAEEVCDAPTFLDVVLGVGLQRMDLGVWGAGGGEGGGTKQVSWGVVQGCQQLQVPIMSLSRQQAHFC